MRVALFLREHADAWHTLSFDEGREVDEIDAVERQLTDHERHVLWTLRERGASFLNELARASNMEESALHLAIGGLATAGLVVSDGFAGVRTVMRLMGRPSHADRRQDPEGRWSPVRFEGHREVAIEMQAQALLARYGVVFRRLLARETNAVAWRGLNAVYRRLEARGEIRGGRFVSGMSGEQFALPQAVERLREVRNSKRDGRLMTISAVDPLNLTGILTSGERVRAITSNRLVYRDGVALAAMEGDYVRPLTEIDPAVAGHLASALAGRRLPSVTSGFIGR
jgi:ATP-dependent Lhr-like helicase